MSTTPAGWFPDPSDPALVRWWDGNVWTQHTQPRQLSQPLEMASNQTVEQAPEAGLGVRDPGREIQASASNERRLRKEERALRKDEKRARQQETRENKRTQDLAAKQERRDQATAAKESKELEQQAAKESKALERQSAKEAGQAERERKHAETAALLVAIKELETVFLTEVEISAPSQLPVDHPLIEATDHLRRAAEHAEAGQISQEETSIRLARDATLRYAPFKGQKMLAARLSVLQSAGLIRRGVKELGVVKAEGFFSQYGRKQAMSAVQTGDGTVTVYNDRIVGVTVGYAIDHLTQAQVYLDGQSQVTQRPTLTRMALLSPLPGSAIVPGLALQKKSRDDRRQGQFVVGSRDWTHSILITPNDVAKARGIAEQINRAAEALMMQIEADRQSGTQAQQAEAAATPRDDVLTRLERIRALQEAGTIDADEAKALKAALLSEG